MMYRISSSISSILNQRLLLPPVSIKNTKINNNVVRVTVDQFILRLNFYNVNQDKLPVDHDKIMKTNLEEILKNTISEHKENKIIVDAKELVKELRKDYSSVESFLVAERSSLDNIPDGDGSFSLEFKNGTIVLSLEPHQLPIFYLFIAKYFPAFDYLRERHYHDIYNIRSYVFPTFLKPDITVSEIGYSADEELKNKLQNCASDEQLTRIKTSPLFLKIKSPSFSTIRQMLVAKIVELLYDCEGENSEIIANLKKEYNLEKLRIQVDQ